MSQFRDTQEQDQFQCLQELDQYQFHQELGLFLQEQDQRQFHQELGQLHQELGQLQADRAQDQRQVDQAQDLLQVDQHQADQARDLLLEVHVTTRQVVVDQDLQEEVYLLVEEPGAKRHHFMGTICPHNALHGAAWPLSILKDFS